MANSGADFATRLRKQLVASDDFNPACAVHSYFGGNDGVPFDGSVFESYGADQTSENVIAAADLVAVTMLSMEVRRNSRTGISTAAAMALEQRSDSISSLMKGIPSAVDLFSLSEDEFEHHLGPGSRGEDLWNLLRKDIGIPRVATYKLLARKRPRLLPIRDGVTERALGSPRRWWRAWWVTLSTHADIRDHLAAIREEADVDLSLLRVADVVIWMRNRSQ